MKIGLALALGLLGPGCSEDETAILLRVCTNVRPADADTIELRFEGASMPFAQRWETAAVGLPQGTFEISLRPGAEIRGAFAVTAVLLDGGAEVVSRRLETAFVAGEDRDATVFLDGACIGVRCDAPSTCARAECGPPGNGTDPCFGGQGDGGPGNCDEDGDGYTAVECDGDDCDDRSPDAHPGLTERCDQLDNDCSGEADDGAWEPTAEAFASFATTDEITPSLASTGDAYGLAWAAERSCADEDDCDGFPCVGSTCDMQELRFVRFDPVAGTPPAEQQIVVSGVRPQVAGPPAVVWNDDEVGILYTDEGVDAMSIYFVSVEPLSGNASTPVQVSGGDDALQPALAWNGDGWAGVWTELSGGSQVLHIGLISTDGGIDVRAPVSPGGENATSGAIDWSGSEHGVAWISEDGTVWLQLVTEDAGFPQDAVQVSDAGTTAGDVVDVVWAGDGWVLAWEQRAGGQLFAAKLDRSGLAIEAPQAIVEAGSDAREPDLAASRAETAIAWSDGANAFLLRLSPSLVPQGSAVQMSRGEGARASGPRISWNEGRFRWGIVWEDARLATDLDVWFNELGCAE